MSTNASHIRLHRTRTAAIVAALVSVLTAFAATAAPAGSAPRQGTAAAGNATVSAYGWPVKPFDRQHPVRGLFGDPRIGRADDGTVVRQFHFGIDVSAPNGTPVYATQSGTVSLLHPDVVAILSGSSRVQLLAPDPDGAERHARRRLPDGDRPDPEAVGARPLLRAGRAASISIRSVPDALGPYADRTRPTVEAIRVARAGSGRLDLVAEVSDDTPLRVAAPWTGKPVMPALVHWRLLGPGVATSGWRTAIDFRRTIPSASSFFVLYADGTRQNHASVQGRYRVHLVRDLDPRALPSGRYAVEVVASDGHGNSARSVTRFTVRHGSAAL